LLVSLIASVDDLYFYGDFLSISAMVLNIANT